MNYKDRIAGVLLPISSLPSPYGIGTLGKSAFQFVDFLKASQAKIWQMLPLNVTSYGDSPYQSPSSNGLNYYFIDFDILNQKGLLKKEEYQDVDFGSNPYKIDYGKLFLNRVPVLKLAFNRFDENNPEFVAFEKKGEYRDFAFFMTLKVLNGYKPWYEWPDEFRNYTPELEKNILESHRYLYLFYVWTQFEFLDEYFKVKNYANSSGIKILGDMPLYLARDSVESYKYPQMFLFDANHNPTFVAGCPPDAFSALGQLWGNPIYDWKVMSQDNYAWFKDRILKNLVNFDILRIDHFRGCSSYYSIPFGRTDAKIGKWEKGPGIALFEGLLDKPLIAEDLGFIDDGVKKLLADSTYPGMKVLEFAFDGDSTNSHKPSNSSYNYFAYTGTHDNMPIKGYLKTLNEAQLSNYAFDLKKECSAFDVEYKDDTLEDLTYTTDKLCLAGPTRGAIIPLQDLLAEGDECRMNLPSSLSDSNWTYRADEKDFSSKTSDFLRNYIIRYHR